MHDMSDITTRTEAGLPSTELGDALMRGVEDVRAGLSTSDMGGKPLLRLVGQGDWVFGQTNEEVQEGSHWAVNMMTLQRGWCCWHDGKLLGQVMVSILVPRPPCPPPINGKGFDEQYSMELTCISGDDAGQPVLYKNNSRGFKIAFADLMSKVRARYANEKVSYWPIVELKQSNYWHKKYNKQIYDPILEVVAWADPDGNIAGQAPKAAVAGPAKAAPAPEPPKPVRQRKAPLTAVAEPPAGMHTFTDANGPEPTQQIHTGQRRRPAAR
jgi:hypothetical protein